MITNIQILRAFAALAVVFYHTDFRLWDDLHTDFQGVAIFFVISGFIIPRAAIKSPSPLVFIKHRLIRIVPIYWLGTYFLIAFLHLRLPIECLLVSACVALAIPRLDNLFRDFITKFPKNWLKPILLLLFLAAVIIAVRLTMWNGVHLLKSLAFIPELKNGNSLLFPVLGQGWTLNMEAFFYVLFAAAMAISPKFAPLFSALVLLAIKYLTNEGMCHSAFCIWYAHPYTTFFIYGILLFYGYDYLEKRNIRLPKLLSGIIGGCGVSAFFAINLTAWRIDFIAQHIAPYAPVLLVFSALIAHLGNVRLSWKPAVLLGDASYALYLFHTNVIEMLRAAAKHFPIFDFTAVPGMLLVLILASLMAVTLHRYIELPLIQACRRCFMASPDGSEPLVKAAWKKMSHKATGIRS
jgi:exopolysaccharide production protein ExoZ